MCLSCFKFLQLPVGLCCVTDKLSGLAKHDTLCILCFERVAPMPCQTVRLLCIECFPLEILCCRNAALLFDLAVSLLQSFNMGLLALHPARLVWPIFLSSVLPLLCC